MTRLITLMGVAMAVVSTKLTWATIDLLGMVERYNGFSQEAIFGNKPGIKTILIAVAVLIFGMINRKWSQFLALAASLGLCWWGISQWLDKKNNFATQEGFVLNNGLYVHALAGFICLLGVALTLRKTTR